MAKIEINPVAAEVERDNMIYFNELDRRYENCKNMHLNPSVRENRCLHCYKTLNLPRSMFEEEQRRKIIFKDYCP